MRDDQRRSSQRRDALSAVVELASSAAAATPPLDMSEVAGVARTPAAAGLSAVTRGRAAIAACASVVVDLLARRRHGVPLGAEAVDALPLGVSGLLVLHEVVDRVTLVGHLGLAVRAGGRAEQRRLGLAGRLWLAGRQQRRPGRRAVARAPALLGLVLFEQVERAAVRADQERAELAVPGLDGRGTPGGTPGGSHSEGEPGDDDDRCQHTTHPAPPPA